MKHKTFNNKVFFQSAILSFCGLSSILNILGMGSAHASSKIIDNLSQEDHFIYQGNLKLTNSKLNTAEIQGSNHVLKNSFAGVTSINGNSEIQENTFAQALRLMGSIKSLNNTFNDKVIINGTLKDKESHFLDELKIIGKAELSNTEVIKTINIDSNDIKLDNSRTSQINFINKEDTRDIKLYLSNNTKITGDINFSNEKGKVYKDNTVIIDGNVVGGEIINK